MKPVFVKLVGIIALFSCAVAFGQVEESPFSFRRDDDAATATSQPNTAPFRGSLNKYGEVYTHSKPGLTACNAAAETGTTAKTILAATAATSRYISQVICYNASTVASIITFNHGATVIDSDIIGTSTLGTNRIVHEYPKPIKTTANTAVTFTMTTTATATVCCINYVNS